MVETALEIETVDDLLRFCPAEITIGHTKYFVLTGFEGTGRCFWCGSVLKGKLLRYCYGHMTEYYNHFNWGYASFEAKKRADGLCQNCGLKSINLEVHHIIPLNGETRFFSAFNLPWNLIALCHDCHMEIHRAMRPPKTSKVIDIFELARARGQQVFEGLINPL
jgi:hypothetical protein